MPRYKATVVETISHTWEFDANDDEDAYHQAADDFPEHEGERLQLDITIDNVEETVFAGYRRVNLDGGASYAGALE